MDSEARKQSMAWMETDYSKHTYFRWKVKWRLEHLGVLGTMGEKSPLIYCNEFWSDEELRTVSNVTFLSRRVQCEGAKKPLFELICNELDVTEMRSFNCA